MNAPRGTSLAVLAVLLVQLAQPPAARGDRWRRDDQGICHREWTPASLSRGPITMVNGLLLPFRSVRGGFTAGWTGALLSPMSFFIGVAEGVGWVATGAMELCSGGALGLVPEGAARRIELGPVVQLPLGERTLEAYDVDLCAP